MQFLVHDACAVMIITHPTTMPCYPTTKYEVSGARRFFCPQNPQLTSNQVDNDEDNDLNQISFDDGEQ